MLSKLGYCVLDRLEARVQHCQCIEFFEHYINVDIMLWIHLSFDR
jgi:hypothetical protein